MFAGFECELCCWRATTIQVAYKVLARLLRVWTYSVYMCSSRALLDQKTDGSFIVDPSIIAGSIVSVLDSPDPVARRHAVTSPS